MCMKRNKLKIFHKFACSFLALIFVVGLFPATASAASVPTQVMEGLTTLYSISYDFTDKPWEKSSGAASIITVDCDFNYPGQLGHECLSPTVVVQVSNSTGDSNSGNWGYTSVYNSGGRFSLHPVASFFESDLSTGHILNTPIYPVNNKINITIYSGFLAYDEDDSTVYYISSPTTFEIDVEKNPSGTVVSTPESSGGGEPVNPAPSDGFSAKEDGWSFVNGYEGFQYPEGYAIPEERYAEVFGDAYVAAANSADGNIYDSMIPKWGGNCYGMSVTAVLFYLDMLNWESYGSLYSENFESVNSYYETIRWQNVVSPRTFISSDMGTEITKLIERYQILQRGTAGGYKRVNSTYQDVFSSAFLDLENVNEYRGWFNKNNTYRLNTLGNYIESVYQKICNAEEPLLLDMFSSHGAHTVVVRTDKTPERMEDGWYRIYIYDPNTPYLSENIIQEYGYEPKSYYLNHLSEDRYIELNPGKNQWRYAGSVRGDASSNYWGSNSDGTVRYYTLGSDEENGVNVDVVIPEYMYVYSIKNIGYPVSLNGNEPWLGIAKTTSSIAITNNSNFSIYALDGTEICQVTNGVPLGGVDGIEFNPYVGIVEGSVGTCGGYLSIPYTEFTIKYEGGDNISIIGHENVINIAANGKVNLDVSMEDSKIHLDSGEDNSISLQLTEVHSTDKYTSINAIGALNNGDGLTIQFSNDALNIESQIIGDSILDVYVDYETNTKCQHVTTLERDNADTEISDVRELVSDSNITLNKNQMTLVAIGATEALTATVSPGDSTNKSVIWTSSRPDVATVSDTGVVTAVANGMTVITATTKDGEFTATCTVTVSISSASDNEDSESGSHENTPQPVHGYTITFDTNGGLINVPTIVTDENGKLPFLPIPNRDGYIFNGWYTVANDGTSVTTDTVFNADTTVYAQWSKVNSSSGGPSGGSSTSGESSSANYSIAIPTEVENGSVAVRPTRAEKGDTVTITAIPDPGYEVNEIIVTDRNGREITVRNEGGNRYIFTMPSSQVKVDAAFVQIEESTPQIVFQDVTVAAYYYDAALWAVEQGITTGVTATTFNPNGVCTRAQIVTFLWRANGSPAPQTGVNPFADVSPGAYYYDAVLWAVEEDITSGTTDTSFSPNSGCTRAQAATFLWRSEGSPADTGSSTFTDVADNAYYADAVDWAVANGITLGTTASTFSPNSGCTRAQIVTFLYRAMI